MTGSFFISSKAILWNIIQLQYIARYISLLSGKRKLFSWAINYYISCDDVDVKLRTLFEGYLALFSTSEASLLICENTSSGNSSKHWKAWPFSTEAWNPRSTGLLKTIKTKKECNSSSLCLASTVVWQAQPIVTTAPHIMDCVRQCEVLGGCF